MALSRCCSHVRTVQRIAGDLWRLVAAAARSHAQLAAENLFLRKQLALYLERRVKPRRAECDADGARRPVMVDRLAPRAHGRETGHAGPMASKGLSLVLAVEVTASWAPASVRRRAAAHR